jgi:hypothetical protein
LRPYRVLTQTEGAEGDERSLRLPPPADQSGRGLFLGSQSEIAQNRAFGQPQTGQAVIVSIDRPGFCEGGGGAAAVALSPSLPATQAIGKKASVWGDSHERAARVGRGLRPPPFPARLLVSLSPGFGFWRSALSGAARRQFVSPPCGNAPHGLKGRRISPAKAIPAD